MSKVLRAFDYSFDGITPLKAKVGDDIDFGSMTNGLASEGYIERAAPVDEMPKSAASPDPDSAVAVDDEGLAERVRPTEPTPKPETGPKSRKRR